MTSSDFPIKNHLNMKALFL